MIVALVDQCTIAVIDTTFLKALPENNSSTANKMDGLNEYDFHTGGAQSIAYKT